MERKNIFNKMIDFLSSKKTIHKITNKDSFITYCFNYGKSIDYENQVKLIKESKGRIEDAYKIPIIVKSYLNISFDRLTGHIKISHFEYGYKYAYKKNIMYPFRRSVNLVSYTDKIYQFHYYSKGRRVVRPSIGITTCYYPDFVIDLVQIMAETNVDLAHGRLPITLKYYKNTNDEFDVVKNRTGVTVPSALKVFSADSVYKLILVMKNPSELNGLCQTLKKHPEIIRTANTWNVNDIMDLVRIHMNPDIDIWLLRDYVDDLITLKKKFSLKMTSRSRLVDEHRKYSKLRLMKKMQPIKTHDHYIEFAKSLPESIELINDKGRLAQESADQGHCVATYASRINNGECCILSTKYENEQYTIEIISRKTGENMTYYVNQCRGKFNKSAPEGLIQELAKYDTSLLVPKYYNYY